MALNRIFNSFPKLIKNFKLNNVGFKVFNWKSLVYFFSALIFLSIYLTISNLIKEKNITESQNLSDLVKSDEFFNLGNYFVSKINSPYKEVKYLIQYLELSKK